MQHEFRTILAVACIGTAFLVGCQKTRIPDSHVKPAVPPLVSEKPSFNDLDQGKVAPEESEMPFVVKTDLTPIQRAVKAAIPDRISGESDNGRLGDSAANPSPGWTFVREGEPRIKMQDGFVVVHATYSGEPTSPNAPDICRANPVTVSLDSTGEIRFEQQGEQLLTHYVPKTVNVGQPSMVSGDADGTCTLGDESARDVAERWFQPTPLKERLSRTAQTNAIALPIGKVWQDLNKPITVATPNMNNGVLCLYTEPTGLIIGQPQGTVDETLLGGVVKSTPIAAFEKECRQPTRHPISIKAGGEAMQSADRPHRILGSIAVPYTALTQTLQKQLFHQQISLDREEPVVVESVTATDAKGRVLIPIELGGGLEGTIYYWGTPQLQNDGRMLRIPDLQMAQESKRALDTFKLGYWQKVDQQLQPRLQAASAIDLGPQIDAMKRALTTEHKAGNMTIDMLVSEQQPRQTRTTPEGLIAYYLLEGTARVSGKLPLEQQIGRKGMDDKVDTENGAASSQSVGATTPRQVGTSLESMGENSGVSR
ncbi:hypothetical protein YTPLAS18_19510 [Nitrospira sp.]|nr:hypothetical protein YTPLAS18_19510 [Nitrospira sp.]